MASSASIPQILVVEDDRDLQELLQQVLVEQGYAATGASSLEQALRLIHRQPFDLILTELFTPTDEETVTSLLPLRKLAFGIPVVVVDTWLPTQAVEQQGFSGPLSKPFSADDLITAVAAGLNRPFSAAQLPQLEVAKQYIAALTQGDLEALIALCAQEVRIYPWIVPPYPAAHPVTGRIAIRADLQAQLQYFGTFQFELVRFYPCPHGVAVRLRQRWHDPTGAVQQQMVARYLQVTADGQISQVGIPVQDEYLRTLLGR